MSRITRRTIIPVNQITPLTHRDGVSYIQMLNELSEYIKSILHPSLQHTVDQVVADVETQMDKHHGQYVDGVQEFQRIHDAFMSDVNASLMALNDTAVTDLFDDDDSLFSQALKNMFVPMSIMRGPTIDPTGQRDSTQGLQEFIDRHPHATMFLPEGVYRFSQLRLTHGQYIQGAGRSTYRDRYHVFGSNGWMNNDNFGGTVLRSTYDNSGSAVTIVDPNEVTEGGLRDLTLIGPGRGLSTGLTLGQGNPRMSLVNPELLNVAVGNFHIGVAMHLVNEGYFAPLIIRGCELGMHLETSVNENNFQGLDVQWCGDGVLIEHVCYTNVFFNPMFQSNRGLAFRCRGGKNALYSPFFENNLQGAAVFEDTAVGNMIAAPFLNMDMDNIIFEQGSRDNTMTAVGGDVLGSSIENYGDRNYFQGRMSSLRDHGSLTMIIDALYPGTLYGAWQSYTPQLGGQGWSTGNSTIEGSYSSHGRTTHVEASCVVRDTTTIGQGAVNITLPRPAFTDSVIQGSATVQGVGTFPLTGYITANASQVVLYATGDGGVRVPFGRGLFDTMAPGSFVTIAGTYNSVAQ